jgi:hypothetical protein
MPTVWAFLKSSKVVVEGNRLGIDLGSLVAPHELDRAGDLRERLEAENVDLENPDLLEHLHLVLGRDLPLVRPKKRDMIGEPRRGDHDTRGVDRRVPGEPFERKR